MKREFFQLLHKCLWHERGLENLIYGEKREKEENFKVRPLNKIFSPISPSQKQIHDFYSFFTE
jgi:hypothetical protein